jgi:hypothetical protein
MPPPAPSPWAFLLTPTWEHLGIWVAALLTLAVYSFLYGDSPLFRVAEHLFVGISAAYGAVMTYFQAVKPLVYWPLAVLVRQGLLHFGLHAYDLPKPAEEITVDFQLYLVIIPILLGLMIFGRFFRGWEWLSRWPIAFVVGFGAGSVIPVTVQAAILEQAKGTIDPFLPQAGLALAAQDQVGNWILALGVLTTLSYFYFSAPHRGWLGRSSRLGVWFLMIAFGAGFGNTVMARVALLIGRMQFLLHQWLPLWWPGAGPPGR